MLHVVLLDNRRLRILRRDPDDTLIETYAVEDPEAVAHERDLRADRPGRAVNAASGSRVALQPKHSARSISLQRWLRTVGAKLSAFLAEGQSDGLVLVASARLLGLLKVALPTEVRRKVLAELARDLAKQTSASLEKRLRPTLQEASIRLRERPALLHSERFRAGD
jgi:protein required for attachment to host cells